MTQFLSKNKTKNYSTFSISTPQQLQVCKGFVDLNPSSPGFRGSLIDSDITNKNYGGT